LLASVKGSFAPRRKMKREEFINLVPKCGYGTKGAAKRYVAEHPKEDYDTDDFKNLYETSMRWQGCNPDKGLNYAWGVNGRTTAFSNRIAGNSGAGQDWEV